MKLTAIVKAGPDGPTLITTTTIARIGRDLQHWQGGQMYPLALVALCEGAHAEILNAAWPYRTTGRWFGAQAHQAARQAVTLGWLDGDIVGRLADAHTAWQTDQDAKLDAERTRAANRNALNRLAGRA